MDWPSLQEYISFCILKHVSLEQLLIEFKYIFICKLQTGTMNTGPLRSMVNEVKATNPNYTIRI